jgi:hypothetical protein
MYDFDRPSERRYGDAISIPVHPSHYPTTTCYIEHLELTIRNLNRPEDRHAQEADGDDGETRGVRACYFGGAVPLCCRVGVGDGEWEACHVIPWAMWWEELVRVLVKFILVPCVIGVKTK